ncbi:gag-protease polyprotein [Cucumis melo var. makuwa]|uniref:Gag-protease polyprotein n=1 Tax=Cucumis melo var. makuwa TaxID=1194695 RepID=A0A5A7TVM9_CUCMM|nr:gag-protease polyprotein [Cucumis melo var. makuwa]
MEHTYQDMQRDALVPFHVAQQTQPAPAQTFVEPQNVPDHLSVEAKHLRGLFFLTNRGTAWWKTAERMLGGDVNQMTWEQFKESFYAKFFSASLTYAKQQEFLNLEQGDIIVEQSTTHADALHLAVDMGLHERVDPSKAARRGSTPGRKRKAELQPTIVP